MFVSDWMTKKVITVSSEDSISGAARLSTVTPDTPVEEAAMLMHDNNIG